MKDLAAALVAAQHDMPVIHKNARANYGSYVTLDELIGKVCPVLNKHGLAVAQFPTETAGGLPGLKTVLVHASGQSLEATVPLLLNGKNDMQALGGAITYARRYGIAAVLGIANDDDDDGNTASAGGQEGQAPGDSTAAGWTWPFGKHKGKTLAETDRGYLNWFLEKSDKEDIKALVREYLNISELEALGAEEFDESEGIPF